MRDTARNLSSAAQATFRALTNVIRAFFPILIFWVWVIAALLLILLAVIALVMVLATALEYTMSKNYLQEGDLVLFAAASVFIVFLSIAVIHLAVKVLHATLKPNRR